MSNEIEFTITSAQIKAQTKTLKVNWTVAEAIEEFGPTPAELRYLANSLAMQLDRAHFGDYSNHPKLGRFDLSRLSHGSVVAALSRVMGHWLVIVQVVDGRRRFNVLKASRDEDTGRSWTVSALQVYADYPDTGGLHLVVGGLEASDRPPLNAKPCFVMGKDPGAHKPIGAGMWK